MTNYNPPKAPSNRSNTLKACLIVLGIYLLFLIIFFIATAPNGHKTVYTTRTGECYHSAGCSSLRYSKFETTIESAIEGGYRRCNNCDPPALITTKNNRDITFSTLLECVMVGFMFSILVWAASVTIFYFVGIPVDQLNFYWYFVSAIAFITLIFFII